MYFVALATDYDGTLAKDGRVNAATIDALKGVRESGRKLILVTGRDLPDLQRAFPELELFDLVVAENGALLFNPAKKVETPARRAAIAGVRRPAARARRVAPIRRPHHRRYVGAERDGRAAGHS